ncbi:MAG: hypothetical protein OSB41_08065 [Kiritimatiellae bacterium]|nr:hypothetical protein [Kiritimatiellia bacterium]
MNKRAFTSRSIRLGLIGVLASAVNARRKRRYELLGISRELFESLDGF